MGGRYFDGGIVLEYTAFVFAECGSREEVLAPRNHLWFHMHPIYNENKLIEKVNLDEIQTNPALFPGSTSEAVALGFLSEKHYPGILLGKFSRPHVHTYICKENFKPA